MLWGGLCGSVALCEERVEGDHTMLWIARWNKFQEMRCLDSFLPFFFTCVLSYFLFFIGASFL